MAAPHLLHLEPLRVVTGTGNELLVLGLALVINTFADVSSTLSFQDRFKGHGYVACFVA
jgi:hypothetical protein